MKKLQIFKTINAVIILAVTLLASFLVSAKENQASSGSPASISERLAKLELEMERQKAVTEISNLMGRYQALHTANKNDEIVKLFAKKTPGGKLIFEGDVYLGYAGVENHYKVLMEQAYMATGMGSLFFHELLSPIVEVAGDAQSAKAQWDAIGGEIFTKADGTRVTVWDVDRYRVDFIKEDGNWVIYNLDWHPVFMTPFDGPGWGAKPTVSMGEFFSGVDAKLTPKPVRDACTKVPYRRLAIDNNDTDVVKLIPALPEPYATWDIFKNPWKVDYGTCPETTP
jgi:hypothetical protein